MTASITWRGTLTALSSLAHGGETRGTITLLRRELLITSEGTAVHVPIVSGNTLRGRLRRIGEELLRDAVGYSGQLHPAAAHTLRGGGSLAKTSHEPLSGSQLATLRRLVPQIAVFGGAGGGTIIGGALDVGKVVPHLHETRHITGEERAPSAFSATQLEAYTRQDDSNSHDFTAVTDDAVSLEFGIDGRPEPRVSGGNQMLFHLETFPAGTRFSTWLRLRRPTELELSFFTDVLAQFAADGRLGGRVGIGHGQVGVHLQPDREAAAQLDWRQYVTAHRSEILDALGGLS